jgi:hypothetical protein
MAAYKGLHLWVGGVDYKDKDGVNQNVNLQVLTPKQDAVLAARKLQQAGEGYSEGATDILVVKVEHFGTIDG